ncbi:carboxylesterase family domain-containing protein [Phthorimaea operculella]|nr:carboxylesterase family domain-containing protein [Phthorimaea operculella]
MSMESIPKESKCIVNTKDGPLCGYIERKNGRNYYKFKGIPYAQPPVEDLRFRIAHKKRPLPLGLDSKDALVGSEDCLYIDVVSPNINPDKPLPVMFWIGNYAFFYHIDDILEPSLLVDRDVIFVRCGFRVGAFGFLSINNYVAPGNCGLKDIVLALKWVQNNISKFGGDPTNVTLFGCSTGGSAVHLLMLSPMGAGLFHKAIIQSASVFSSWSLGKNPKLVAMELAKELEITSTSLVAMVEELKKVEPQRIAKANWNMMKRAITGESSLVFNPCIEEHFEGLPAFLTKTPKAIIKSGNYNKVPFIIGSNKTEASIIEMANENFHEDFEKYNKNPELIVPRSMSSHPEERKRIGLEVLKFYLNGECTLKINNRTQYLQFISDYHYLYYVHKAIKLHSKFTPDCPIYYYVLDHTGEWDVPENLRMFNSNGHCAELPLIFGVKKSSTDPETCRGRKSSIRTRKKVIKLWTNFAKYGNPTPDADDALLQIKWDAVENPDKLNYLCIGSELTKGRNPFHERMEFWERLHREYRYPRARVFFNDYGVTSCGVYQGSVAPAACTGPVNARLTQFLIDRLAQPVGSICRDLFDVCSAYPARDKDMIYVKLSCSGVYQGSVAPAACTGPVNARLTYFLIDRLAQPVGSICRDLWNVCSAFPSRIKT